jgi:hypothetical protein
MDPSACLAMRPVSSRSVRPARSSSTVNAIYGLLPLCPTDVHRDGFALRQAHVSVHLCDGSAGCRATARQPDLPTTF